MANVVVLYILVIFRFGREIRPWKKTLVKPTPDRLQEAWRWVMDLQCEGSRNFMGALRTAVENEEERQHNIGERNRWVTDNSSCNVFQCDGILCERNV